jgi:hypothetical protein
MRSLLLVVALAACQAGALGADQLGSGSGNGSGSGEGGAPIECASDIDCTLAAAKCCDCPTFAVPANDPAHKACGGITCPAPTPADRCPKNVTASCVAGACVLECASFAATGSCPGGYALDPTGCLEDACATVTQPQCSANTDCVRTRADCCGCQRGGTDTAVPALDAAAFDAGLGCSSSPTCPGNDTCAPNLAPRCIEGACELTTPLPANACTGTCPGTQRCMLNVDPTATMQGVGVCM